MKKSRSVDTPYYPVGNYSIIEAEESGYGVELMEEKVTMIQDRQVRESIRRMSVEELIT